MLAAFDGHWNQQCFDMFIMKGVVFVFVDKINIFFETVAVIIDLKTILEQHCWLMRKSNSSRNLRFSYVNV